MSDATVAGLAREDNSATVGWRREQKLTIILLSIAALARIPFWWRGFGGHPDEWLVIRSGLDFWLHKEYLFSRPIGYPFDEILMGGLAWLGGSPACAAAATVASLITLLYMRGLAVSLGIYEWFWVLLAFSFEPWVWSSGTHSLDYIWGTGALTAALYYVERGHPGAAGVASAIGFGFRWSSPVWIAPLLIRVLASRDWVQVARFVIWGGIAALIPLTLILRGYLSQPYVVKTDFHPILSATLAAYRFIELIGVPALLIIIIGGYRSRDRLSALWRSRQEWVWCYLLIALFLLVPFVVDSGKPEYMLPALPGLFMILGRCLSSGWWKAITAAFVVEAFLSFGFGHVFHTHLSIKLAMPSLRPGALLWYEGRAKVGNAEVAAIGAKLAEPGALVPFDPDRHAADEFYVSSLLSRGPAGQARIFCPLVPGAPAPASRNSAGFVRSPVLRSAASMLVCCSNFSVLLPSTLPRPDDATELVRGFCPSGGPNRGPPP